MSGSPSGTGQNIGYEANISGTAGLSNIGYSANITGGASNYAINVIAGDIYTAPGVRFGIGVLPTSTQNVFNLKVDSSRSIGLEISNQNTGGTSQVGQNIFVNGVNIGGQNLGLSISATSADTNIGQQITSTGGTGSNLGLSITTPGVTVNDIALWVPDSRGALAIGTTTASIASVSVLAEFKSTSKAVLLPRMTTVQLNAIGSPIAGMIAYNMTSNTLAYYNGTSWVF